MAFGLPDRQSLVTVDISVDASCEDAIKVSGLAKTYADIDLAALPIAIWGTPASRTDTPRNGDRIEILRPLAIDPRNARRELASEGQFMGGRSPVETDD